MNVTMDALTARQTKSKQAPDSAKVRAGLKEILLGTAQLYEALRGGTVMPSAGPSRCPPLREGLTSLAGG